MHKLAMKPFYDFLCSVLAVTSFCSMMRHNTAQTVCPKLVSNPTKTNSRKSKTDIKLPVSHVTQAQVKGHRLHNTETQNEHT